VTAVIEAPAGVVMVTADGETRAADMWGRDSFTCTFCRSSVYGPVDWEQHERDNEAIYARDGDAYTWQPYSHARYWEARECANPGCVTWLTAEALERVREGERRTQEREDQRAAEKAREQAKTDAAAAREARAAEIHSAIGDMGRQLGFAWACTHTEKPQAYGAEPVMCEASGWDRGEYDAHVRGHGAKAPATGVKPFRLRKRPPAASLPKLEVSPFKFITWTEDHTEPGLCECGHTSSDHHYWHTNSLDAQRRGGAWKCGECDCIPAEPVKAVSQTAERRGQYWANGPAAHSVWVVPFELAPWESGQPAPVLLYAGRPGRFHQHAYSAKYDRR
jgi:hypothetical protein